MDLVVELLAYVKEKYGITPEHPWKKSPENMTLKDEEKGLLMDRLQKWLAIEK